MGCFVQVSPLVTDSKATLVPVAPGGGAGFPIGRGSRMVAALGGDPPPEVSQG